MTRIEESTRQPFGGAWRKITEQEAIELKAKGGQIDWLEGAGWVVYDQQALDEFEAECEIVRNIRPRNIAGEGMTK